MQRSTALNAKKATLRQGQPSSLKSISADTEMNTPYLLNKPDNTGPLSEAQVVLAPLVAAIDHAQSVQILGQSGEFDIVAVRREDRVRPRRNINEDHRFFGGLLALFGAENLARCICLSSDATFEVSGSAYGLASILRRWDGPVVDAGCDLRWVDPVSGKVFPLRGLAHLAEVVGEYAARRAVSE